MVEAVARAIHVAWKARMIAKGSRGSWTRHTWEEQYEEARQDFLVDARAAIEAVQAFK